MLRPSKNSLLMACVVAACLIGVLAGAICRELPFTALVLVIFGLPMAKVGTDFAIADESLWDLFRKTAPKPQESVDAPAAMPIASGQDREGDHANAA